MRKPLLDLISIFRMQRQLSLLLSLLLVPLGVLGQTITVAGISPDQSGTVTGTNISGTVSFNSQSNTLTLTDATITGDIVWSNNSQKDLTILMSGKNSVIGDIKAGTPCSLHIEKITDAESATLKYTGNIDKFDLETNFEPFSIEDGGTTYNYYTTADVYELSFGTIQVHSIEGELGYKGNILKDNETPTVTFDGTNKITLNGATLTNSIMWAIKADLTIELKGTNSITTDGNSCILSEYEKALSFTAGGDNCSLELSTGTSTEPPILYNITNVTYDGLVLYSDNYIAIPEPPTMALNNNDKVELTITYSGGTIATKYSIDYADETADVTNATYSDPFEMAAPGTVTAWVEANGATTSTVKGKHFGYESKTFTMKSGETKAVVLAPAIETSDNIALADNPYASDAEGVATLSNAVINAIGIGKANLSTTLANTNDREHTVILNKDNMFTIEVNVGAIMEGVTFAPNMLYATYCNTTSKNMTVPEGMTAYAVTGTEGNNVTTEVVEFLPMNVPLLLMRSNASTEVGMSLEYDGTATAPATNILNFTNSNLATTGKEYVLYNDEFVKATSTIPQKHCYLLITNPASTRGYYSIGHGNDGSTAIDDTLTDNEETANDDWYDLQGRRIQKPTKAGIYIVNGKKMIVK